MKKPLLDYTKQDKNGLKKAKCSFCGDIFNKIREHGRFCSANCRFRDWDKKHPRIKCKP